MNSSPSTSSTGALTAKEYSFKLILLGDTSVGKTSLLRRYAQDEVPSGAYTPTIGVDFRMKQLTIEGEHVRALIWDTAGQERFKTMTAQYYRGSHGVILVYDVTNPDSFLHVQNWLRDFERFASGDKMKILVGNKCDVSSSESRVSEVEGQLLGIELGVPFFETSAKTGTNVEQAFLRIITDLVAARRRSRDDRLTPSPSSCWNFNDAFSQRAGDEEQKRRRKCCF